jgi:hypothetical protein
MYNNIATSLSSIYVKALNINLDLTTRCYLLDGAWECKQETHRLPRVVNYDSFLNLRGAEGHTYCTL